MKIKENHEIKRLIKQGSDQNIFYHLIFFLKCISNKWTFNMVLATSYSLKMFRFNYLSQGIGQGIQPISGISIHTSSHYNPGWVRSLRIAHNKYKWIMSGLLTAR